MPSLPKSEQNSSERICSRCKIEMPLDAFARQRQGRNGRRSICRWCDADRAKAYLRDPEKQAKRRASQLAWYHANRAKVAAQKANSYRTQRAQHLVWEARRRAARKGVPFDLDVEAIGRLQAVIDAGVCEVSGARLNLDGGMYAPSLDRIDPQAGYVPGNVRVVARWLNAAMGEWGADAITAACLEWASRKSRRRSSAPTSETSE